MQKDKRTEIDLFGDDETVKVPRKLLSKLGVRRSLMLAIIRDFSNRSPAVVDGYKWCYRELEDLTKDMATSKSLASRALTELKQLQLVHYDSIASGEGGRRSLYRVNYENLDRYVQGLPVHTDIEPNIDHEFD